MGGIGEMVLTLLSWAFVGGVGLVLGFFALIMIVGIPEDLTRRDGD